MKSRFQSLPFICSLQRYTAFGAAKGRKNTKTGGTNNKEKNNRKNLPLAARVHATKRRTNVVSKRIKDKQFKAGRCPLNQVDP